MTIRIQERWKILVLSLLLVATMASTAPAVHFYRGQGGGCTPKSGQLPAPDSSDADATVLIMHSSFHDTATGTPVTRIQVDQTVEWVWSSAHCHSVDGRAVDEHPENQSPPPVPVFNEDNPVSFYSGFHWPTEVPQTPVLDVDSQQAIPGFLDYPIPTLEEGLSYRRKFTEPGVYNYYCEHHWPIGMLGTVIVEEP